MGFLGDVWDWIEDEVTSPFEMLNAFSGKSGVEAQKQANEYNLKAVQDTNATNLAIARENNEITQRNFEREMAENRRYFEETQAYNSAAAAANRYREAGLNPVLAAYQGVNAGSVSASSAPASPNRTTPVMQAPQMQAIDYSQMQSFLPRVLSLATGGADFVSVLANALTATSNAQSAASTNRSRARMDRVNASVAEAIETNLKEQSGLRTDIMRTNKEILNKQLLEESLKATMAQFTHNILASDSGQEVFKQSVIAEWEQKVSNKNLTDKQIERTFYDTIISKYESEKGKLTKAQYEMLNSILDEMRPTILRLGHSLGKGSNKLLNFLFD